MIAYLDTSAALRIWTKPVRTADERTAAWTAGHLDALRDDGHTVAASVLLRTELRCQADRQLEIDHIRLVDMLSSVSLVQLEDSDLEQSLDTPGRLRTLDAIHLTGALRIGATHMAAYDAELLRAARSMGMSTGPQ